MSLNKTIDRKEFFTALGLSSAALALICTGCAGNNTGAAGSRAAVVPGLDFTLDLNAPANAALKTNGGFLVHNTILVARTSAGNFIAVQQACTHQGSALAYQSDDHQFYCSAHGSTFSDKGTVINGPAEISLASYKTTLSGSSLRIQV